MSISSRVGIFVSIAVKARSVEIEYLRPCLGEDCIFVSIAVKARSVEIEYLRPCLGED